MNPSSSANQKLLQDSESMREALTKALHATTHRVAKQTPGGFALLFTVQADPEGIRPRTPQLRLAAGFATPKAAQESAKAVNKLVDECIESAKPRTSEKPSTLEKIETKGILALPVSFGDMVHGVLVLGTPLPVDDALTRQAASLCNTLALLLNQFSLADENIDLQKRLDEIKTERATSSCEKSPEELLELSERLFTQDVQVIETNQVMKKIEKLKSDFIEKMSRELRTPLNDIIESIIAVIANEADALSDSARSLLRYALDNGSTFQRTLENILELWRIRQGEIQLQEQELDVSELINEAIFTAQDTLRDKPVEIRTEFQESLPRIRTDLAKLTQIAFHLLDNAVKFTPSGSVTIRARIEDNKLQLEVEDTGIGICPEDLQLVFDEFFQVDDTRSGKYQGSGLGLALVKEFTALLGGSIEASSEIGLGSRFQVAIPVVVVKP